MSTINHLGTQAPKMNIWISERRRLKHEYSLIDFETHALIPQPLLYQLKRWIRDENIRGYWAQAGNFAKQVKEVRESNIPFTALNRLREPQWPVIVPRSVACDGCLETIADSVRQPGVLFQCGLILCAPCEDKWPRGAWADHMEFRGDCLITLQGLSAIPTATQCRNLGLIRAWSVLRTTLTVGELGAWLNAQQLTYLGGPILFQKAEALS